MPIGPTGPVGETTTKRGVSRAALVGVAWERHVGVATGRKVAVAAGCSAAWSAILDSTIPLLGVGSSKTGNVGCGANATAVVGSSRTETAVANGSANTAATASLPPASLLWALSLWNHSASAGSRSEGGNAAAATTTSSTSPLTSSTNAGSSGRPAASKLANSCIRRSTWLMCHAAGSPKALTTAP